MSIEGRFFLQRGQFVLDVQLKLPTSGVTAIFGSSGCGKTSLLRSIAGLEKSEQGFLKVNGSLWQDDDFFLPPHLRSVAYVFQEASLFSHLSVKANLEYGLKRAKTQKTQTKNPFHFDDIVELLGIETLLSRSTEKLSGGERQRVAIARALVTQPKLLLMDEPLAALDVDSKAEILPFLERMHEALEIPVLYISHSPDEVARLADYLLLMEDGKITSQGPLSEILADVDSLLAHRDDAFTVLQCRVEDPLAPYHLTTLSLANETLCIPRIDKQAGQAVRLRVQARDVSLCLDHPQRTSILNVLPAKVPNLSDATSQGQRLVRLDIDSQSLLARVSERSCEHLAIKPGMEVFAQIKAMAMLR
jgi:molybdate transport system ATP-binding protein